MSWATFRVPPNDALEAIKKCRSVHSGRRSQNLIKGPIMLPRRGSVFLSKFVQRTSLFMARNGHAAVVAPCPLLGAERKTYAPNEFFRF
jgi:hypothetical protein